jgi:hypothetical protein
MVAHAYNPSYSRGSQLKARLGKKVSETPPQSQQKAECGGSYL